MKKILTRIVACFLAVFSFVSLASCRDNSEELLNLVIVQEANGVVSEDFTVVSELVRGEETYPITWTSDSANLVVSETVNDDKTYTIKVTRPDAAQVTAHLTATLNKASKQFEFKINPYDVYDFSAEFLFAHDKGNVAGEIELPTSYTLKGTSNTCEISWAAADPSLISVSGNKAIVPYTYNKIQTKLTATFTYGGETTTKSYTVYIYDQLVYVAETELAENQPYYLGFLQKNLDNAYYFADGGQSGNYGSTTTDLTKAMPMYVKKVDGGYNIYYKKGEDTYYLNGNPNESNTSVYVDFTSKEATTVWTWNTEYNTFTMVAGDTTFYMGSYSSYATLSCSKISYAATSFVSQLYKEGVMDSNVPTYTEADKLQCEYLSYDIDNQYEGELELITKGKKFDTVVISYEVKDSAYDTIVLNDNVLTINNVKTNTEVTLTVTFKLGEETKTKDVTFKVKPTAAPTEIPAVVEEVDTTKEYYFGFENPKVGTDVHFITGGMSGNFGSTTTDYTQGAKVTAVAVDGGYNLKVVDAEGATKYLNVVEYTKDDGSTSVKVSIDAAASSVFAWDAEYHTFTTMVGEEKYYMGTYSTFTTLSASKYSYIATSYPSHFYEVTKVTDEMMVEASVNEIKAALALGTVSEPAITKLVTTYDVELEVTLPENSATLIWNAEYLVLTVTPTENNVTEKITVKVTRGEVTETVEVSITSQIVKETTVTEALTLADGTLVSFEATVIEVKEGWSSQYKNMSVYVTDGTSTILVYRLKSQVSEGNKVVITGAVGSFNDAKQIAAGATAEIIGGYVTLDQVANIADGCDVVVAGVVKSVDTEWSEQYSNMSVTITDGTTDLYVFRTKTLLVEGNTVVITGKVGSYNGVKQIAQGSTANLVSADYEVLTIETEVYDTLTLPATGSKNASEITWTVKEGTAIAISEGVATITQPETGEGDTTVVLTATITNAGQTMTKDFTVTVKEKPLDPNIALVAADKAALTIAETAIENFTLPLVGSVNSSVITWTSNNAAIAIDGANATVTRPAYNEENATVTLTATLVLGEATNTATFTVVVAKKEITIADVIALDNDVDVVFKGVVVAVSARGYVLWDETAAIYVYAYNGSNNIYEVGKYVEVTGKTGYYNVEQVIPTSEKVLDAGNAYTGTAKEVTGADMDAYISGESYPIEHVKVSGKLSISGSYYNLNVEGASTAIGSLSYLNDAQKEAAKAGNVTITGWVIGCSSSKYYNIMVSEIVIEETPAVECTIAEVSSTDDGTAVIVTGIVKNIDYAWSDEYSNMSVTITDGTKDLYIFRLGTKVELGQEIKVTGVVTTYSGAKQIAEGATAEVVGTATDEEKVEIEINEIKTLFPNKTYSQESTIEINSLFEGTTVSVVAAENSTSNSWTYTDGVLTITPVQDGSEETIVVTVTVGEESAQHTVTIKTQVSLNSLTATMVASELGLANAGVFESWTDDTGNVTLSATKNSGTTNPAYYTSGTALRLYGKNTFTISVKEGYKIAKIEITTQTGSNGISDTTCTITNATAEGLGTATVTLIPTDGTLAVELTNPNSSGNFRIKSIVITYSEA